MLHCDGIVGFEPRILPHEKCGLLLAFLCVFLHRLGHAPSSLEIRKVFSDVNIKFSIYYQNHHWLNKPL
jgi:hypothetical protein